ncbi:hypothetical protein ACB098_04G024000 [Castanea mollissima]
MNSIQAFFLLSGAVMKKILASRLWSFFCTLKKVISSRSFCPLSVAIAFSRENLSSVPADSPMCLVLPLAFACPAINFALDSSVKLGIACVISLSLSPFLAFFFPLDQSCCIGHFSAWCALDPKTQDMYRVTK